MFDQADIDALLASATDLVDEAAQDVGTEPQPAPDPPNAAGATRTTIPFRDPAEVNRILKMRVPIIVRLAQRKMPLTDILALSIGSIVEFERLSDADLDLLVSNREIGMGQAVKVGENFGLRLTDIGEVRERIEAMGLGDSEGV